jgi:hypothetical protein
MWLHLQMQPGGQIGPGGDGSGYEPGSGAADAAQ